MDKVRHDHTIGKDLEKRETRRGWFGYIQRRDEDHIGKRMLKLALP